MGKWNTFLLGDILTFQRGYDLPKSQMADGKYPVVGSNGIIGYHNEYTTEAPSVTIGRSGNTGNPFILYGRSWSHNTTLYVKEFKNSDPVFIYYLLKTLDLNNFAGGSAVPTLNRNHIHTLEVTVPPLTEQIEIGRTLRVLDDKITDNTALNHHLEQLAQAVFKSWFVDFEPWGGVMPEDWREIQLSEIVETVSGYSYKGSELVESKTAMATIKNFERGGGFKLEGFKEIIPSSKVKPSQFVDIYDTIVAHTDLTQKAEVIGNAEMLLSTAGYDKIVASLDLVKVLPTVAGLTKFVLGAILRSPLFKEHCLGYVNGTTVLHMSKRAIPEYTLVFPRNTTILADLDALLAPTYKQMALNIEESERLTTLRDTLLPSLMSGELSVSDIGLGK